MTWTYEVAAKQINAITTNTALSDSESVRKFGRARLTNRPRMLGATAARTKYKGATITQNIGTSREPRGAPNVQQPTTAEVLRHSATIARKPGKLQPSKPALGAPEEITNTVLFLYSDLAWRLPARKMSSTARRTVTGGAVTQMMQS